MTGDLFADAPGWREELCSGAAVLRQFVREADTELIHEIGQITRAAPFRHMETPGGFRMSVAMTSCGTYGWVTSRSGYRYSAVDPQTGRPWPAMPAAFSKLAEEAAEQLGFHGFSPDACLINRYGVGAKLSLHQDKDEQDLSQPVVSVSLGLPAAFQFGDLQRSATPQRVALHHGDVVVWGGDARLRYHGILPLKPGVHPLLGECRINLTFRKAG
jgi:alkylated DNA repair protein (DNA oxidative demethylase)